MSLHDLLDEQLLQQHQPQSGNDSATATTDDGAHATATTTTTTQTSSSCCQPGSGRKKSMGMDELRKPLKTIEKRLKNKKNKKSVAVEMMLRERRPSIDWSFWWSPAVRSACMPAGMRCPNTSDKGCEADVNTRERRDEPSGSTETFVWTAKQLDQIINNSPLFIPEYRAQRRR
jgi:hypothetical protein